MSPDVEAERDAVGRTPWRQRCPQARLKGHLTQLRRSEGLPAHPTPAGDAGQPYGGARLAHRPQRVSRGQGGGQAEHPRREGAPPFAFCLLPRFFVWPKDYEFEIP